MDSEADEARYGPLDASRTVPDFPAPALIEEARKALGLYHSSTCAQSVFAEQEGPCNCGAAAEAKRIVVAVAPLIAEQD